MQKSFESAALAISQDLMLGVIQPGKCCVTPVEAGSSCSGKLQAKRGSCDDHEHFEAFQKIIIWPAYVLVIPRTLLSLHKTLELFRKIILDLFQPT